MTAPVARVVRGLSLLLAPLLAFGSLGLFPQIAHAADTGAVSSLGPVAVTQTGTAPYPSGDSGPNDNVVASGDQVKWSVPYTIGIPGSIMLVATLPAGASFDQSTVSLCETGSSISSDGRTATCAVAPATTGSGAWNLLAKVTGGNQQTVTLRVSASGLQSDSPATTIIASPAFNFQTAGTQKSAANGIDLVFGYQLWVPVDPQFGLRGREPLSSPFTFTIDASSLPAGWSIDNCNTSTTSGVVPGRSGGGANGVTNSGTATCAISGDTVTVTVAGADTTALSYPSLSVNGSALPADRAYVVSSAVSFLLPGTALPNGTTDYQLQARDFDPASISGQSNLGSAYAPGMEPGAPASDGVNSQTFTVKNSPAGGVAVGFYWNPPGQPTTLLPGWRNTYTGNNPLYAGEPFMFRQQIQNNSPVGAPLTNATGCLAWDTSLANITGDAVANAAPAYPIAIEYGVLSGTPLTQLNSCGREGDGTSNWYPSLADVPGGASAVSAVRYLVEVPLPAGGTFPYPIMIPMQRTASVLANGAPIPFAQSVIADGFTVPVQNGVSQIAVDGQLSNTVSVATTTLPPAATTTVTVQPRVTNPFLPDVPVSVAGAVETVTVPDGLTYVNGSGSLAPTSIVMDASGNTVLTFDVGTLDSAEPSTPITFRVQAATDVVMPQGEVITSVISAPGNADPATIRTATASLAINAPQQFGFAKSASAAVIQPGDPVTYTIADFNTLANPVGPYAAVDVLPYNGDVNGTTGLTSFRVTELASADGMKVFYTTDAPASVRSAVQQDVNTTAVSWQSYVGGTVPTGVTAIKTTAATVNPNEVGSLRITLGNIVASSGGVLANSITALFAQNGTTVPVADASTVTTSFLSSALTGEVYRDLDHDGSLSSGDTPVANKTVTLSGYAFGPSGTDQGGTGTNVPVASGVTAVTDSSGVYRFPQLPSGVYTVTTDAPAGTTSNGDTVSQVTVGQDATVTGRNIGFYDSADAPVANPDAATIPETKSTAIDVLANDTGSNIRLDTSTPPSATAGITAAYVDGKLVVSPGGHTWADGELSYTVSVIYTVIGIYGLRSSSTAVVTVVRAPQVADDSAKTGVGRPVTVDVLKNDAGTGLTIIAVAPSIDGTTEISDGQIVFSPNTLTFASGTTSFTYMVRDSLGQTAEATVVITVVAKPVVGDDSAATGEGVPITVPVLANDSGSNLSVTSVATIPDGLSTVNQDGTISFAPAPGFIGEAQIVYSVTDVVGQTATGTLRVRVVVTPVARPDSARIGEASSVTVPVIDNDSGDGIAVASIDAVSSRPAAVAAADLSPNVTTTGGEAVLNADGTVTFTAIPGFVGTVAIEYTITDELRQTAQSTLTIEVVAPPTAPDLNVTTVQGVPVKLDPASRAMGSGVHVTAVETSADGTVVLNVDGTITFAPAERFTGATSFTYRLTDDVGQMATGTITVTVGIASAPTPPPVSPPVTATGGNDAGDLAGTGSNLLSTGFVALVLLLFGGVTLVVVRRRKEGR
ncbi:beta strand repeat-containing protein [Leifsonia aquatica]|uniref:beta strand repeat-containing protein n=1 Tax=Leifsonia aquatica TaxID=144185 RepID=UPI0037FA428F